MSLFDSDTTSRRLPMPGADVTYHPSADLGLHPDEIFRRLVDEIPWGQQGTKWGPEPRLTSWHADDGVTYTYSGRTMVPQPLTPLLETLRAAVQDISGACYNSVLLNLYRDGRDSIGFHADDEPELGRQPTIASISLGAERIFELQSNDRSAPVKVLLEHGSVLVMAGDTQRNWKHGIRKVKTPSGPRINLTFRHTRPR